MRNWLVLSILLLFFSCKKETPETLVRKEKTAQAELPVRPKSTAPPVYLDTTATAPQLLKHLETRYQAIKEHLSGAGPSQSDRLYQDYKKEDDSAITLLNLVYMPLLENFSQYDVYNEKLGRTELKLSDSIRPTYKALTDQGLEFWYVGEGMYELRRLPDHYVSLFLEKVSPDYKEYLKMEARESRTLYYNDAAIVVPWHEVGRRIAEREAFLQKYPASTLGKTVKEQLNHYRIDYLLGSDNSPVREDGKIYPEYQAEFNRFMARYPQSKTTVLLREFLKGKYDKNPYESLEKALNQL